MNNQLVDDIFTKLSKLHDFKLTKKQLYSYLNKSKFEEKIEEIEDTNNISPYTIFVKEKLEKKMNLDVILKLWKITKETKEKYQIYLDKYNEINEINEINKINEI